MGVCVCNFEHFTLSQLKPLLLLLSMIVSSCSRSFYGLSISVCVCVYPLMTMKLQENGHHMYVCVDKLMSISTYANYVPCIFVCMFYEYKV